MHPTSARFLFVGKVPILFYTFKTLILGVFDCLILLDLSVQEWGVGPILIIGDSDKRIRLFRRGVY